MKDSGFFSKHPVLSYYILAFAISWGAFLAVVGPHGIPGKPADAMKLLPALLLAMLAGPVVANLSVTGLAWGRAGYRELWRRLTKWRAGIGGYSAALLTAPLIFTAVPLAMAAANSGFVPRLFNQDDKLAFLLIGLAVGLMAGIFEELGWTGFVMPRMRLQFDSLTTGVIVGFLWGAWHLLINFWSSGTPAGTLSIPTLVGSLLFSFGILPAFRVLMVFVWDHTGSLPAGMLMHSMLTASSFILAPTAAPGAMGSVYTLSITAALWIAVGVCALASRGHRQLHSVLG